MKRTTKHTHLIITIITTLTIATTTHARVFLRWGGADNPVGNMTRLGGKIAYSSDIKINNGEGKLTVIGFNDPMNNTTTQIQRILNISPNDQFPMTIDQSSPMTNPTTSLYLLCGKKKSMRLILLQLPHASRLLAITIEQSTEEFLKSQKAPTKHKLSKIPAYPGSTPTFYAESSQTKFRMAISSSNDNIEAIRGFYHSRMQADGWIPYLSDSMGSIPQLTIYQRGNELCYILATPSKKCQTISVLYKQLTI